jgi:hypothetical protein
MPGRLKLAIQQVLDQSTPYRDSVPTNGYEDYYAAVRPSLTPGSDAPTEQHWAQAATEYSSAETSTDYYSGGYAYTNEAASYAHYGYEQTDAPPSYDESYHTYHGSTSASSYQESGAATTLLSLQGSGDERGVVEAHGVESEVACVEGELVPDHTIYPAAVELGAPAQREASDTSGTWRCGQCTYLNAMTSSFCEMCIGHISLSPDVKSTAGTSVSASLLVPAKQVVEVVTTSPQTEPPVAAFIPEPALPGVTCMLPPVGSLYSPSAPEFDLEDAERGPPTDTAPRPPPPPYPGISSHGSVDFLALAFNGSRTPKTQAAEPPPTAKASQRRREEATIEYTF